MRVLFFSIFFSISLSSIAIEFSQVHSGNFKEIEDIEFLTDGRFLVLNDPSGSGVSAGQFYIYADGNMQLVSKDTFDFEHQIAVDCPSHNNTATYHFPSKMAVDKNNNIYMLQGLSNCNNTQYEILQYSIDTENTLSLVKSVVTRDQYFDLGLDSFTNSDGLGNTMFDITLSEDFLYIYFSGKVVKVKLDGTGAQLAAKDSAIANYENGSMHVGPDQKLYVKSGSFIYRFFTDGNRETDFLVELDRMWDFAVSQDYVFGFDNKVPSKLVVWDLVLGGDKKIDQHEFPSSPDLVHQTMAVDTQGNVYIGYFAEYLVGSGDSKAYIQKVDLTSIGKPQDIKPDPQPSGSNGSGGGGGGGSLGWFGIVFMFGMVLLRRHRKRAMV